MDTLGLETAISTAIAECKVLTPNSISACITGFSNAIAAEIKDCGNGAIETAAFVKLLWNDVKNLTFDQQGALRIWAELPVVVQAV